MEVVARQFVDKMLVEDMISEDDKEWYVYSLQLIIEKLFSVLSLLLISIIMGYFFQTIGFLVVFSLIRNYSGGFHFKHFSSCYFFSTGIYLVFILLFQRGKTVFTSTAMLAILLAILGILCIGSVSTSIGYWNEKKRYEKSSLARLAATIIYVCFVGLKIAGIEDSYLWFMGFGICLSFAGLIAGMISNIKKYLEV